jgi:mercuric reductase
MPKIQKALDRLNGILPLFENQQRMSNAGINLHRAAMRGFVDDGVIPNRQQLLKMAGGDNNVLKELEESDTVIFDDNGEPIGSYPFTMDTRDHHVMVNGHSVHAMCALDALSVHPMYQLPVEINSVCAVTGDPIRLVQEDDRLMNNEARDVHVGINWNAAQSCCSCADSLCTEMLFLKNKQIAEQWLSEDQQGREIFTLDEAISFGSQFFTPLLEVA